MTSFPAITPAFPSGPGREDDRALHVAVVDEELPYPLTSGKRIRTMNLLLRLARRHRLTLLCHANADAAEGRQAAEYLRDHGITPVVVPRTPPPSTSHKLSPRLYAYLARNLLSSLPYSVQVHTSRALRQALADHAARQRVDVWHCEWSPLAQSLPPASFAAGARAGVVVVAHNVESLIWQRYYEQAQRPLVRWYIGRQWAKFQRFERRVFATATRVVTVSEADADLAREQFAARRVSVVENGVDLDFFATEREPAARRQILFLGSLDWRPNLDGVAWLLDDIWPLVRQQAPAAELNLVGRKPPAWLVERVRTTPGVVLHADVPDVRPHLANAAAMIVPLRIGGGTRLKILESAAAGVPVISTTVGAEGLLLTPGEDYAQADTPAELAAQVARSLREPDWAAGLAVRAERVARELYG